MLYVKPHFYDRFSCIADRCPDTCCAGWQIMIDEESLLKYSRIQGGFGNRLLTSIDWEEGTFLQFDGRCSCLNDENLCDLYQELGKEYLCRTCRMYPRHVEEFDGVREYSLSLSCPEAAKMMLECREPLSFVTKETPENEPDPDEEFDFLMYSRLNDIRDMLFQIVQNRDEPVAVRMERCLKAGIICQNEFDNGNLFGVEEKIRKITKDICTGESPGFQEKEDFLKKLFEIEFLREQWKDELSDAHELLFKNGDEFYRKMMKEFMLDNWERYAEQLLMFFLYTYFCGAVYDNRIYSKVCLGIFSTVIIHDLCVSRWIRRKKKTEKEDVWEISWLYAREIEHSDENLEKLETYFDSVCCESGRNNL